MLKKMLEAAVAQGFTLQAVYEGETDYIGGSVDECLEALEACDEMNLYILLDDYEHAQTVEGWALIIPDLDDEEKVADCTGWVDRYMDTL